MASIAPFTPFRYNPDLVPDLGAVIAPPYDVISPDRRDELIRRDPRNVVRLILPEGTDDSRYDHAAELFREWIASGVLTRDGAPGLWLYAQSFDHPDTGDRVERRGFISLLHLEPFSAGIVLPHERTLSGPKADRLKLMETTRANLEPIFGVYPDGKRHSGDRIGRLSGEIEPLVVATDADGVEHRLWHLTAQGPIEELVADLAGQPVFIVDGHHRYETALNYQAARQRESGSDPAPYDSIMIFLAPVSDPGLVILPTHRIIHSLESFDLVRLLATLEPSFELIELESPDAALLELESLPQIPTLLLASHGRLIVARQRNGVDLAMLLGPEVPESLRELDVTILHEYILERLLGISKEAQASQRNLQYVKSADEALDAAERHDVQLAVLMNPTRLSQVEKVALSGEVMPQKSTFFYPKLASGLLFNPLW